MDEKSRYELYCQMIDALDCGVNLVEEYDAQLHDYNGVILYQAEAQIIKLVGNHPGITAAECAAILKKTVSACSQLIKKLRQKEWVVQERNETNNRLYNLYLTKEGKEIFKCQRIFEENCYQRTFSLLEQFSTEDLRTYLEIQNRINTGFAKDVEDGKLLELNQCPKKKKQL